MISHLTGSLVLGVIWELVSLVAWSQVWQTIYNGRAKCHRVGEKTTACYFLIGALALDTAEPWSDARTAIWRIPLVFVALEVPLCRKCDMSQGGQRSVVASVMKLYSSRLSVDLLICCTCPFEPHADLKEGMSFPRNPKKDIWKSITETLQPADIDTGYPLGPLHARLQCSPTTSPH